MLKLCKASARLTAIINLNSNISPLPPTPDHLRHTPPPHDHLRHPSHLNHNLPQCTTTSPQASPEPPPNPPPTLNHTPFMSQPPAHLKPPPKPDPDSSRLSVWGDWFSWVHVGEGCWFRWGARLVQVGDGRGKGRLQRGNGANIFSLKRRKDFMCVEVRRSVKLTKIDYNSVSTKLKKASINGLKLHFVASKNSKVRIHF